MLIRDATADDWPAIWAIIREVHAEGDTFCLEPDLTEADARGWWLLDPPGRTVVAQDDGEILATAEFGPNRPGQGAHVSTASFMVGSAARGRGVGGRLVEWVLEQARTAGYAGMQFNAVVETNEAAVRLYERLGFTIVGTVPGAFAHPTLGRVGLHVMYCLF
ncbi:MAG: GNAT family N-acetyltransferase [Williamsia herbipolensis]|nr:GNAT family N-acetyltransferase [Williamsia herbipolensis]